VLRVDAQLDGLARPARARPQHDIDGAGDRLHAQFGRCGAQDVDALDQLGRQRGKREAGRRGHAIEQDLGVAVAEAAHADLAAAGRIVGDGDAGDALERVGQAAVALAQQLVVPDYDGAGAVFAALVVAGAGDFDFGDRRVVAGRGWKGER
jgi:hypothetical protein